MQLSGGNKQVWVFFPITPGETFSIGETKIINEECEMNQN